jgi:ABC-type transport system involved in multi-copper enzyme maturation permease subunit
MASLRFFNEEQIVRYVKELCLFLILLSSLVIAITAAARQIPAEREQRTIFPLLAKPVSRSEIVLGKFLGCWAACGAMLVCFYFFFALLCFARQPAWQLLSFLQALALHWVMLGIVIAFTLAGSLVFAAPSSTVTISALAAGGVLLVGRHLNKVALQMAEPGQSILYAIYLAIPHLELFDVRDLVIHDWPPIAWPAWLLALAYGFAFISFFVVLACWRFERMTIAK